jgi:hypothetical protein
MKKKHMDFIAKFHKSTSRHLNLLSHGGIEGNSDLKGEK